MGPLSGLRILEFEAIGPVPFAGMMLADMGADVLLVDRPTDAQLGIVGERRTEVMFRGRRSIALDLKREGGVRSALRMAERADAVLEGFRPGVMERLGLGPEAMHARNRRLVYGRMTGWGQDGPLARRAGHDINYIALSGALDAIGRAGAAPTPPLNLVGDFGGGGMLLAFGIACAVIEARASGRGQVVDAAMLDGAALLATMFSGLRAAGQWSGPRGCNVLDSGAPWYDTYETSDGRHVVVGAIEPKFYAELIAGLGLDQDSLPAQHDREGWPALRKCLAERFRTRSRDHWAAAFADTDACVSPVLTFAESELTPQRSTRAGTLHIGGIGQPAPAPRFSRTAPGVRGAPPERGEGAAAALADWGFDEREAADLIGGAVVAGPR